MRWSSNDGRWEFDVSVGCPVFFGFGIFKQWTLLTALGIQSLAQFLCRPGQAGESFRADQMALFNGHWIDDIRHAARRLRRHAPTAFY